jgi:hypothetical protein
VDHAYVSLGVARHYAVFVVGVDQLNRNGHEE